MRTPNFFRLLTMVGLVSASAGYANAQQAFQLAGAPGDDQPGGRQPTA